MWQTEPIADSPELYPALSLEEDATVKAFARWLSDLRARNAKQVHETQGEMALARDGVTAHAMDLADLKNNSAGSFNQLQAHLNELREQLTYVFADITGLVQMKTQSDQEQMLYVSHLEHNVTTKTAELEALKRTYDQAHQFINGGLTRVQSTLVSTAGEVERANNNLDRIDTERDNRLKEILANLSILDNVLAIDNAEARDTMMQLRGDITKLKDGVSRMSSELVEFGRETQLEHNRLQAKVWEISGRQQEDIRVDYSRSFRVDSPTRSVRELLPQSASISSIQLSPGAPSDTGGGVMTSRRPASMVSSLQLSPRGPLGSVILAQGVPPPPSTTAVQSVRSVAAPARRPGGMMTTSMVFQGSLRAASPPPSYRSTSPPPRIGTSLHFNR